MCVHFISTADDDVLIVDKNAGSDSILIILMIVFVAAWSGPNIKFY